MRSGLFILLVMLGTACQTENNHGPAGRINWDKDGMMVVNGKRTFIIGTYHLPEATRPFTEAARQGYNYIRVGPETANLDSAKAHHLMTWVGTGSIRKKTAEKDRERITGVVNKFKKHPAMLCWEMEDEPAFTWNSAEPRIHPEPLIKTFKLIKGLDPEHPVITNHAPVNLVSTLIKYNPSTDIVSCDIYPVIPRGIKPDYALFPDGLQGDLLNTYISQVGDYTDKMKKVAGNKKPVFMVLQAFSWEMLKEEEDRDTSMILYPGYKQSRFMAFDAIVHGATGVIYWGSKYTPQPSEFMTNLNRVTRELSGMLDILSAENFNIKIEKVYHELGHSLDKGVEMVAKEYNKKVYLITVNPDKNPVKVSFNGLMKYKSADVLNEKRTLKTDKGILTDFYEPFDVHIYKLN